MDYMNVRSIWEVHSMFSLFFDHDFIDLIGAKSEFFEKGLLSKDSRASLKEIRDEVYERSIP